MLSVPGPTGWCSNPQVAMVRIRESRQVDVVVDVCCDICGQSTRTESGPQFGELSAAWGYGSPHDGERYHVDLCEQCFFGALSSMSRERMVHGLCSDEEPYDRAQFGRVDRRLDGRTERACLDNPDLPGVLPRSHGHFGEGP